MVELEEKVEEEEDSFRAPPRRVSNRDGRR